jgi:hypothetical protein
MLFILSWSRSHTLQIHPPMLDFFLQSSFKKRDRERGMAMKKKEKNAHTSMEHDDEKKKKERKEKKEIAMHSPKFQKRINGGGGIQKGVIFIFLFPLTNLPHTYTCTFLTRKYD